ncbi:MAG: hypothetical protein LAN71_11995 [Acidobacteriia bacterium]|nr:hypothetical protein [Terriglobia bacterium]
MSYPIIVKDEWQELPDERPGDPFFASLFDEKKEELRSRVAAEHPEKPDWRFTYEVHGPCTVTRSFDGTGLVFIFGTPRGSSDRVGKFKVVLRSNDFEPQTLEFSSSLQNLRPVQSA